VGGIVTVVANMRDDRPMLTPDLRALTEYLGHAGWRLVDDDERTSLWRPLAPDTAVDVVLPSVEAVADYGDLVAKALRALSYVERRLPSEIVDDMTFGGADTLAIRLTPDAPPGEAPLELAHAAVEGLRSLVVASAAGLITDALVLPQRRPARAEAYAKLVRISTQSGSFVLSLALPLNDSFDEPSLRDDEDSGMLIPSTDLPAEIPFGRRVTDRVAATATYAAELADMVNAGDKPISVFGEARVHAPNATELAALASLGGPGRDLYELRIARSPLAGRSQGPMRATISPGHQRVFAEASEFLRTKQPRAGVTVSGLVVRLARAKSPGPGEVVIHGVDDDSGAARRFHVELTEEDYRRAVEAHGKGWQVHAQGNLQVRGTRLSLRNLTSFGVVPGLDDD
jgi:hypothetical protein